MKEWFIRLTYQARRAKRLDEYREQIKRLDNMSQEEVTFEYVEAKSMYERKKSSLSMFFVTILISVLMNVLIFGRGAMERFSTSSGLSAADAHTGILALVVLVVCIVIGLLLILADAMNEMYKKHKKLLIIEQYIKKKEGQIGGKNE
ncbi:MAG: hypothetical protein RSA63_10305 [Eubacterium sp.]